MAAAIWPSAIPSVHTTYRSTGKPSPGRIDTPPSAGLPWHPRISTFLQNSQRRLSKRTSSDTCAAATRTWPPSSGNVSRAAIRRHQVSPLCTDCHGSTPSGPWASVREDAGDKPGGEHHQNLFGACRTSSSVSYRNSAFPRQPAELPGQLHGLAAQRGICAWPNCASLPRDFTGSAALLESAALPSARPLARDLRRCQPASRRGAPPHPRVVHGPSLRKHWRPFLCGDFLQDHHSLLHRSVLAQSTGIGFGSPWRRFPSWLRS